MKGRNTVRLSFAAVSVLALSACSGESRTQETSDDALVRGKLVPSGEMRAVLELGDDEESFCTAAKVGPRTILTAAHCVVVEPETRSAQCKGSATGDVPNACEITSRWSAPTVRVRVRGPEGRRWVRLPIAHVYVPRVVLDACRTSNCFWDMKGHRGVPDIAIVEVGDEIPTATTAAIDVRPVSPGTPIVVAGYGCTRSGDRWVGDDELRADDSRTVALSSIANDEVSELAEHDRAAVRASYFFSPASAVGESSLCPGDSGGSLFTPSGDIIGINAYYVPASQGSTMRANMFTRLDAQASPSITAWLHTRLPDARFIE